MFSVKTIYSRARKWGFDDSVYNREMKDFNLRSKERLEGSTLESKGIVKGDNT